MASSPQADQRAAQLADRLAAESPSGPGRVRPVQDRFAAQTLIRSEISGTGATFLQTQFHVGRVVDVLPYGRLYKVIFDRGPGTALCVDATQSSLGAVGARTLVTYAIGSIVLVAHHPQWPTPLIVASVAGWLGDPSQSLSDFIVQGSRVGIAVDGAHTFPYTTGRGLSNYSSGRPIDALASGEWGAITETGIRLFIDSFMAQFAVDEVTGIFAFYTDQLLRVAGYNLQLRSSSYVRDDLDDEDELTSESGFAVYPWEASGLLNRYMTYHEELTAEELLAQPERARYEPVVFDQEPILREQEWHAYLGQGGMRAIGVPSAINEERAYSLSDAEEYIGLYQQFNGLDGFMGLRSARGILIAKTPIIPLPKRIRKSEDATGDTAANYASSGAGSGGSGSGGDGDHRVGAIADPNAPTLTPMTEMAALADHMAYAFNWQAIHPFHYHRRDWYLPEEQETEAYAIVEDAVPQFHKLAEEQYLPAPEAFSQFIDERYGAIEYYANTAVIFLSPAGGVVIADGYGAELRMAGGTIAQHAPGDYIMSTGRRVVQWAGQDYLVKAHRDFELVASTGDGRIKADRSMFVLGGNETCGGILLETRSPNIHYTRDLAQPSDTITGITLRAPNAAIATISAETLISVSGTENGNIVLDANAGSLIERANQVRRHLGDGAIDIFTSSDVINEYRPNETRFGSGVVARGNSYLWGCTTINGAVVVSDQVAAGGFSTASTTTLDAVSAAGSEITGRETALSEFIDFAAEELGWLTTVTDVEAVQFRFPDSANYAPEGWVVYEPLWHQRARLTGQSVQLGRYVETVAIDADGGISMPFPGYDGWTIQTSLAQQDLTIYDAVANAATDRDSEIDPHPYEEPALAETRLVALENNWLVVGTVSDDSGSGSGSQ